MLSAFVSKFKLLFSTAGLYLLRGWFLLHLRQFKVNLKPFFVRPTPVLSGALMVWSLGTPSPLTPTASSVVSQSPATTAIQPAQPKTTPQLTIAVMHDGTGQPAPDLQGVPQAAPHAPGSAANRYARGNCTWYVASKRAVPSNWGNANTWLPRARAQGYATGTIPVPGAVAWTPAGVYGHVAYVEQVNGDKVLVSEMNYRGYNITDTRWVPSTAFKYIY